MQHQEAVNLRGKIDDNAKTMMRMQGRCAKDEQLLKTVFQMCIVFNMQLLTVNG